MSSTSQDVQHSYGKHVTTKEETSVSCPTQYWSTRSAVQLLISAMSGVVFGLAIEKSRVFDPHIIRAQMLFTNFTMLKMFLSACATGMVSISILSIIPDTMPRYERIIDNLITSHMTKSVTGVAVGGAILGCGMTLAGACPGMVLAQVGAAVPDAIFTVLGGLCGAYLFALTETHVARLNKTKQPYYYYTLDEYFGSPYLIVAMPLAAFLGMVVFTMEVVMPWKSEVEQAGDGLLCSLAWPPFISGIVIGLLQIPTIMSMDCTLGSSTGYMTVASQAMVIKPLENILPYLNNFRSGVRNWWQVFYMGGAILGAHLSAKASDSVGSVSGVGHCYSFFGGMLMIYGARVAGGCTSGHGLSGLALLMLLSFVAVPSMFAGGITIAFLMNYVGIDM